MKNNKIKLLATILLVNFSMLSNSAIFAKERAPIQKNVVIAQPAAAKPVMSKLENKINAILDLAKKHIGKVLIINGSIITALTGGIIYSQIKLNTDNKSQKQEIKDLQTLISEVETQLDNQDNTTQNDSKLKERVESVKSKIKDWGSKIKNKFKKKNKSPQDTNTENQ